MKRVSPRRSGKLRSDARISDSTALIPATPKARKTRGGSDRCRKSCPGKDDGGGGGSRTHVRETRIEGFYVRIPDVLVLAVRVLEQGTPTRRPASKLSGSGSRLPRP